MSLRERVERLTSSIEPVNTPKRIFTLIRDERETDEAAWARENPGQPFPEGNDVLLIVFPIIDPQKRKSP